MTDIIRIKLLNTFWSIFSLKSHKLACLLLVLFSYFGLFSIVPAYGEILLDFDTINATHGRVLANGYLANFHITIKDVTPGTMVVIDNANNFYKGRALVAPSVSNVLTQINSNDPVSFTLNLPAKAKIVKFTRPALLAGETGITFPEWHAQALDENGNVLAEVGEPLGSGVKYYSDVPAQTFILQAAGIKALRFSSRNMHFAAFSAVVIDDLVIFYQ